MKNWLLAFGCSIALFGCSSSDDVAVEEVTSNPAAETTTIEEERSASSPSTQAPADTTASTATASSTLAPSTSTTSTTTTAAPTTTTTTKTTPTDAPAIGVLTGAQRLANSDFEQFAGQRLGLIAHQNSIVDSGHLSSAIADSENVELAALFGPEHGVRGDADAGVLVNDEIDPVTGAPVFSLFGPTRKPTPASLANVDVLLYDLQDVGTRYYTYISTMGLAMQAAAEAGIPFVVLDRPNPLGGQIGGDVLDQANSSFVGQYAIPDVYGLTSGELANFIITNNALAGISGLELEIIELDGWDHSQVWEDTDLEWIPPSPAIADVDAATLYPATIYFEATNLSYGRGTTTPFQIIGAPWLDAVAAATELNARQLPGVNFVSTEITPDFLPGVTVEPAFLGQTIPAVQLVVDDATSIRATEVGVHLLDVMFAAAANAGVDPLSRPDWLDQLSGSSRLRSALTSNIDAETIVSQQLESRAAIIPLLEAARLYE